MVKHIQKKLLGRISCGLLMVTGFMDNMIHGSYNAPGQLLRQRVTDMERIYLDAVERGDLEAVVTILENNPQLNFNATNGEGNTDLMLAIRGGGQDEWGVNYQVIFALILQHRNRNWNLRNGRGQTALALALGWARMDAIKALLEIDAVDPNVPNVDGTTPLVAAICNTFVPENLRVAMALLLIGDPRINVNQRGLDNKLPLELAFGAGLAQQLSNPICRRSLVDGDATVKRLMREMLQLTVLSLPSHNEDGRLSPNQAEDIADELLNLGVVGNAAEVTANPMAFLEAVGEHIDEVLNHHPGINVHQAISQNTLGVLLDLVALWNDPRVNVDDYETCQPNQLIDAIHGKVRYLRTQLAAKTNLGNFDVQLWRIGLNTQLFNDFLTRQDPVSLGQLFTQLQ